MDFMMKRNRHLFNSSFGLLKIFPPRTNNRSLYKKVQQSKLENSLAEKTR